MTCLLFLFSIFTQCFAFHKPCRGAAQFLQAEMRRPASRLPVQFYVIRTTFGIFFKTLYGTTFSHTARLHKFMNNQTLPLRAGCRGHQPLQSFRQIRCAAKSLRSLRILRCAMGWKKRCRVLCSDTALILLLVCFSSIAFLHRFCRLTPIEALPQAPQGTLSLDPASPLTPGLCLRFISRYARC